jgi:hydrogenase nickel incorporation protein HypA/HybF
MHELGMSEGVLAAVEKRAAGRSVDAIGVRVGERLAVVPEAFEQSFQVVAQGGVADGATVEITAVPGDELMLEWLRYRAAAEEVA